MRPGAFWMLFADPSFAEAEGTRIGGHGLILAVAREWRLSPLAVAHYDVYSCCEY